MSFDPDSELQRHGKGLQRLARALLRSPHDGEEAVQDTWLAVLQAPRPTAPGGWLQSVLRRMASRVRRGAERRRRREAAVAAERFAPPAAEVAAHRELLRQVVDAVLALDEPFRGAIWQRYFEGRKPGAIAQQAGVPLATVKSRLQRGLAQLRARLGGEDAASPWRAGLAAAFGIGGAGTGVAPATGVLAMGTAGKVLIAAAVVAVAMLASWWAWDGSPAAPAPALEDAARAMVASTGTTPAPAAQSSELRREVELPAAGASAPALVHLAGRIVAAETGAPMAGCSVVVADGLGQGKRTFATETDGSFDVGFDEADAIILTATADGRASRQWHCLDRLRAGQREELGTFALRRGFTLRGIVVDENGAAVAKQDLWIWATAPAVPGPTESGSAHAKADERGRFAASTLLGPGEWRVNATGRRLISPATFLVDAEQGVEPITIVTAPWPHIAGVVVDDLGQPVAQVQVSSEQPYAWANSGQDGRFELQQVSVAAGTTRVVIVDAGRCEGSAPIEGVAWGAENLRLVLQHAPPLHLQVVTDDGHPVEEFGVICRREHANITAFDAKVRYRGPHAGGRLDVEGVGSGPHSLRVVPADAGLEASATLHVDGPGGALRVELARRRSCRVLVQADQKPAAATALELVRSTGGFTLDTPVVDWRSDTLGQAPIQANVAAGAPVHELLARVVTDAGGGAVIPVGEDRRHLALRIRCPGRPAELRRDPALDPDGDPLRIELGACGTITGKVELRGGDRQRYEVLCEPVDAEAAVQRWVPQPDGSFASEPLLCGRYRVSLCVRLRPGQPFVAMPRLQREVVVTAEPAATLALDVGDVPLAALHGRIRVAGADDVHVELVRQHDRRDDIRLGPFAVDGEGRFMAEGVLPGDYRLAFRIGAGAGEILPGLLAETFTLAPGEVATREFTAQRRRLAVHLQTADGQGVQNAIVLVRGGGCAWPANLMFAPRVSGDFVFDPAPDVPITFCLRSRDMTQKGESWSEPVSMPEDRSEAEVTVVLR